MTQDVRTLIRELADDMKAIKETSSDRMDTIATASNTNGAVAYSEKLFADLAAKYRDKPLPKLSDELRNKLGVCIPEIK